LWRTAKRVITLMAKRSSRLDDRIRVPNGLYECETRWAVDLVDQAMLSKIALRALPQQKAFREK